MNIEIGRGMKDLKLGQWNFFVEPSHWTQAAVFTQPFHLKSNLMMVKSYGLLTWKEKHYTEANHACA